jgi:hypothetical protein
MEDEDTDIFTQTIYDTLRADLEENNLNTEGVDLTGQNLVGRRALEYRYHDRNLRGWHGQNIMISNVTQRMLPIGSSALDATLVVTGTYRPPPYHDLDLIAEDSINRQGEKVVSTLRERGERAGREFFSRVQGIEAVAAADITKRPTQSPTGKPTTSPTGLPTPTPSMNPTSDPSSEPSSIPSRSLDQTIMTGSREDLQLGGKTTSSYGFVFNVRTNDDSPTIVVTGLDFYTEQTEDVNYEVWSKLGTFQGFKGKLDEWDLISKGVVKGKGIGRYTPIPEESFTSISIPGGGGEEGTRAIYITLDEKSLVYKIGTGVYADEVIQVATPDIQVWEGESVLSYPFPNAEEYPMFYRFPRQFLGALHIDRLPCNPFSLYGPVYHDLPCPKVPTASPTLPMPTKSPVTEKLTFSPTTPAPITAAPVPGITIPPQSPTRSPSAEPTSSMSPTYSPTEPEPTASPIIPIRANFVSVFRNVPLRSMNEREEEKFKQILETFLQKLTEDSMALTGIDIWHQKVIESDSNTAKDTSAVTSRNNNRHNRNLQDAPKMYSLEVTVIMKVSYSFLPISLLGSMAAETIDDNKEVLLGLLRGQNSFYSYFKKMDDIYSIAVDTVTNPPTQSPVTQAQLMELDEITDLSVVSEDDPSGSNFAVYVGVGVAALWCCLTAISITYVLKMRGEMEEMHEMEDLLAQEKVSSKPVMMGADSDTWKKKSNSTNEDEEAPQRNVQTIQTAQASTTDPELGSSSRKSFKSSHGESDASMPRSDGTNGERRRSRKTSLKELRGSLTGSITELKGSVNKSIRQVNKGAASVRRDGIVRSSRRSSNRSSSATDEKKRRSTAQKLSTSSVQQRAGSSIASARRSSNFSTTSGSVSTRHTRQGPRSAVSRSTQDHHRKKRSKADALYD